MTDSIFDLYESARKRTDEWTRIEHSGCDLSTASDYTVITLIGARQSGKNCFIKQELEKLKTKYPSARIKIL